jgi:hypothetical protein
MPDIHLYGMRKMQYRGVFIICDSHDYASSNSARNQTRPGCDEAYFGGCNGV